MRTFVSYLLASLVTVCVVMAGCSFTTAHFTEVTMAKSVDKDYAPTVRTVAFNKSDPVIYCCAQLANAPSETKVKAVWVYKPKDDKAQDIDSAEITTDGSRWVGFSFRPAKQGMPYGEFAVNLYIDGTFKQSVPFTVNPMFAEGIIREAVIAAEVTKDYFFPQTLASDFKPEVEIIYLPVFANEAPVGTVITARWFQGTGSAAQEIVSTDFQVEEDGWTGWVGFNFQPAGPLPEGQYSAQVSLNGQPLPPLVFAVK